MKFINPHMKEPRWWLALPVAIVVIIIFVAPCKMLGAVADLFNALADFVERISEAALRKLKIVRIIEWILGRSI